VIAGEILNRLPAGKLGGRTCLKIPGSRLRPAANVQFAKDIHQMSGHGGVTNVQPGANFLVGKGLPRKFLYVMGSLKTQSGQNKSSYSLAGGPLVHGYRLLCRGQQSMTCQIIKSRQITAFAKFAVGLVHRLRVLLPVILPAANRRDRQRQRCAPQIHKSRGRDAPHIGHRFHQK